MARILPQCFSFSLVGMEFSQYLATWAEIVHSCHSRRWSKRVIFLHAPCRFSGSQCRQGNFRADNDQMPGFSCGTLCVWRYAKILGVHSVSYVIVVLYAVGIVELELESTSALILLLFVIPLAFTLSGFLMWILHSLTGTANFD